MGRKKKKRSLEEMFDRGEKFFRKGNFPLAKAEFEKIFEFLPHDDIGEKIALCKAKIAEQRAKELIRKGRKNAKRNNFREALRCFEEAYELSGEDWLSERISELRSELAGEKSFQAAKDAEISGDYEKAAKLYGKAGNMANREDMLMEKARSLVKAGKYEDAVAAFDGLSLSSDAERYDHGFALAKTGKYRECLKIWSHIGSRKKSFLDQKAFVRSIFEADMLKRIEDSEDIWEDFRDSTSDIRISKHLMEYARYVRIGQLWKEERYGEMLDMLLPYPKKMDGDTLAMYAKLFFRLVRVSKKHTDDFIMFWLTALYHPDVCAKLSSDQTTTGMACRALLRKGRRQLGDHADREDAIRLWEAEKENVDILSAMLAEMWGKETSDRYPPDLVCTSRFARKFGKTERIMEVIRKSRDFFSDTEEYLYMGACYSSAGESLFHADNGDHEQAIAHLPAPSAKQSEFEAYAIRQAHFACVLDALEKGEEPPAPFLKSAAPLFDISSAYEKILTTRALDARKHQLQGYEDALTEVHSKRPSKAVRTALSLVMVRNALVMFKKRKITIKATEAKVKKAIKLDPGNEFAQAALKEMRANLEMEELVDAIDSRKINRACRVAAKSEHDDVKEAFFDFIRYNLGHMDKADMDEQEKLLLLNDFSKWGARVDESHKIMREIDKRLDELGRDR